MKFITVRDLRSKSAQIWKELKEESEIVLTLNGKPIAILSSASADTFEEVLYAFRRARALAGVTSIQERSFASGRDKISMNEINREITAYRKSRAAG